MIQAGDFLKVCFFFFSVLYNYLIFSVYLISYLLLEFFTCRVMVVVVFLFMGLSLRMKILLPNIPALVYFQWYPFFLVYKCVPSCSYYWVIFAFLVVIRR
jgi:hypothetical protein